LSVTHNNEDSVNGESENDASDAHPQQAKKQKWAYKARKVYKCKNFEECHWCQTCLHPDQEAEVRDNNLRLGKQFAMFHGRVGRLDSAEGFL
jgi:hypothetical protein